METRDVQCNLIKIDVEGAEVDVLKRASRHFFDMSPM
jgi:hypothetical protein